MSCFSFLVHETSKIRFELNYHPVLKTRTKSLGSITLSVPELLLKAPTGADRESCKFRRLLSSYEHSFLSTVVEYRIPSMPSSGSRSSSDSDRSQQNSQPINTGEGPLLKFSVRDLVATGAASDALLKASIGDTPSC